MVNECACVAASTALENDPSVLDAPRNIQTAGTFQSAAGREEGWGGERGEDGCNSGYVTRLSRVHAYFREKRDGREGAKREIGFRSRARVTSPGERDNSQNAVISIAAIFRIEFVPFDTVSSLACVCARAGVKMIR